MHFDEVHILIKVIVYNTLRTNISTIDSLKRFKRHPNLFLEPDFTECIADLFERCMIEAPTIISFLNAARGI